MRAAFIAVCLVACTAPPAEPFCEPGVPCAVATAEYCAHGLESKLYGRAAFSDSTCVARDDTTCRDAALTCAQFGQCSFSPTAPTGTCAASADRDFLASRDPACTRGTCVARGNDCEAARVCRDEGRCVARDGVCVADDKSCRDAAYCATLGWCTSKNGRCRPTAADCARSERCDRFGDCGLRGESCASCERSDGCRAEGLCALVERSCRATDTARCRASEACQREQRCRAFQGACVR
jgi:hypothetical protein